MWSNFKACTLEVGELYYQLYECPAALITKLHKCSGFKPQKFILSYSGSQKSEIKVRAGPRFL